MMGVLKTLEEKIKRSGFFRNSLRAIVLSPMFIFPYTNVQSEEPKPKIVFVSSREPHKNDYEIYSMNLDGTEQTRLTISPKSHDINPSSFPNGSEVAWESYTNGKPEVWVMGINGDDKEYITDGAYPRWRPDGNMLVYAKEPGKICTIDRNGVERAVVEGFKQAIMPAFSPDGKKIIFSGQPFGLDVFHLYIVNADGSGITKPITNNPKGSDYEAHWGKKGILFRRDEQGLFSKICKVQEEGAGLEILTSDKDGSDLEAVWCPNEERVFYTTVTIVKNPVTGETLYKKEVFSMNPDGSEKESVTKRYEGTDWGPTYAPVGKPGEKRKSFFNKDLTISP